MHAVVTGFLRSAGDVLLLCRSDEVGTYPGLWGAVAGHAEGEPAGQIRREIREETGIDPDEACRLVHAGDPFEVADDDLGLTWRVHPYLFDCDRRSVRTNRESTDYEWTTPTAILDRETVPELWSSYDRVRPTVDRIRSDTDHGSAYISLRALEVLRDEAGLLARDRSRYGSIEAVGRELLAARPAMTVVRNRVNRVLFSASGSTDVARTSAVEEGEPNGAADAIEPATVESLAHEAIGDAIEADTGASATLRGEIAGKRVGTLSRSGTVLAAIEEGTPEAVLVAESRPGGEGIEVAERLSTRTAVTLTTDSAFAHQLVEWDADLLVVGADTVFRDGTLCNKAGTRPAALAAREAGIPVVVATATDKISHDRRVDLEQRPAEELYGGDRPITVENPTFDLTPPSAIDRYLTERGAVDPGGIEPVADEHARHARWLGGPDEGTHI